MIASLEQKRFSIPDFIVIESGALGFIGSHLKKYNDIKRVLIITDDFLKEKYVSIISDNLKKSDIFCDVLCVQTNSLEEAMTVSSYIINHEFDTVLSVGGGKVIDVGKYATFLCKQKFISIPTAISHDGINSPIAVLKTSNGTVRSFGSRIPYGVIIDLNVISESPSNLRLSGVGDILSNLTALFDWKLANNAAKEPLNDFAYLLSEYALNSVLQSKNKNINDVEFLKVLSEAIVLSGISMEIATTSRPCSGSEHLFSHALDLYTNVKQLHGIQVAIGSVICSYLQNNRHLEIIEYLNMFNINYKLSDNGISFDDFRIAMLKAKTTRKNRYTILDQIEITEDLITKLYHLFN